MLGLGIYKCLCSVPRDYSKLKAAVHLTRIIKFNYSEGNLLYICLQGNYEVHCHKILPHRNVIIVP